MRHINADALQELLPVEAAIEAVEGMFASDDPGSAPPRLHLEAGDGGTLLVMPATSPQAAGVKLVTVNPANPPRDLPLIHGLYVLFDADRLAPALTVDGAAVTTLRTAAVSAVATRHLARPDASRLVILGAGAQARAHLDALPAVRPITSVTVVSRSRAPAEALAQRARDQGLQATVGDPDAVAQADIVCACTSSATPVFDGTLLAPGTHVNAIGGFTAKMRELDDAAISQGPVVVEQRDAALREAGDVVIPLRSGVLSAIAADLFEVCRGEVSVRSTRDEVTLFKSVGMALEDLAVVAALGERAG